MEQVEAGIGPDSRRATMEPMDEQDDRNLAEVHVQQVGDVGVVLHHKDHCGGRSVEFAHRLHRPTPAVGFGSSLDSPHDDRMMIL
ncbi:MAG TPA: hypothetical protein DCY78_01800 [Acidimicrobiaceae bacterium]|nr:hypothetical protein [Acidimicrobiaceae bacterium]